MPKQSDFRLTPERESGERSSRDPRVDPMPQDVLHKWDQKFLVTRVSMGCVFTMPRLSAAEDWVGVMFFRAWAQNAEVVYAAEVSA